MQQSRWALVSLLLMLMLVLQCDAKNPCGGDRALASVPGTPCDPGPHADCKQGQLVCAGENSLFCACARDSPAPIAVNPRYQSSISHTRGWNLDEDFCERWKCGEHGVCLTEKQACHCYPGYSGNHCEIHDDPCAHQTCGAHGICVNGRGEGEWSCQCLEGYTGRLCDTQTRCQPNGVWKNGQCKCREGYVGKHCNMCDKDAICLPTTDQEQPFVLTFASETARQELLDNPLPSKIARRYAAKHPILPNTEYNGVLYDCACQPVNHFLSEDSDGSSLSEGFLYIDDEYWSPYAFSRPSPHHYREDFDEYYRYNYYDVQYQNAVAAFLTLILFGIGAWVLVFATAKPSHSKPVPSTLPQHHSGQAFTPQHTEIQINTKNQNQLSTTSDESNFFTKFVD